MKDKDIERFVARLAETFVQYNKGEVPQQRLANEILWTVQDVASQAYEEAAKAVCPCCDNELPAEWREDYGRWHPKVSWVNNSDMICEATQIHILKDSLVSETAST